MTMLSASRLEQSVPPASAARSEWHLITSEYPPQCGGVSDHTHHLAQAIAERGDTVHIWCSSGPVDSPKGTGVVVHRELGDFSTADLVRVGRRLDEFTQPRRLLVQWVPHGYGYRTMNVAFCVWLLRRARVGDQVELIVHEPFLPFGRRSWKQNFVALVHRAMLIGALRAARRIWVSTPSWIPMIQPYALGRPVSIEWLPIGANVPVVTDPMGVSRVRARYADRNTKLVGHFGTYGKDVRGPIEAIITELVQSDGSVNVVLLGQRSELLCRDLLRAHPQWQGRVHATGFLGSEELSRHLSSCDLMIQPFPDGVSCRRTSVLAALAHSLPTVTTIGHLTEPLWADEQSVVLVPTGEIATAVAAIKRLLGDPQARRALSAGARSTYERIFSIDHAMAALQKYTPSLHSVRPLAT